MPLPVVIGVALVLAVAIWAIVDFNALVALRNRAQASWSDIDVQLKRRHDLVGNLVEAVKGYARHESATLEQVTQLRARATATRPDDVRAAREAESALGGGIRGLLAIAEGYPDLKADAGYRELQQALVTLEGDLQNARRYYNAVVRDLNTRIQSFPDLFVARAGGFTEREFFELDSATEAQVPKVDLGGSA